MNPFGTKTMKRLSLEELKAQKTNVVANLDAIKGGDAAECHNGSCTPPPCDACCAAQKTAAAQGSSGNPLVSLMVTLICLF